MESLRQGLSQKILDLRRPWRASSIFHFSSSFKQIVYDSYMQAMQCYDFKLVIVDHQNLFFVSEKELSHAEGAYGVFPGLTYQHTLQPWKTSWRRGHDRLAFAPWDCRKVHPLLPSSFPWAWSVILLRSQESQSWEIRKDEPMTLFAATYWIIG